MLVCLLTKHRSVRLVQTGLNKLFVFKGVCLVDTLPRSRDHHRSNLPKTSMRCSEGQLTLQAQARIAVVAWLSLAHNAITWQACTAPTTSSDGEYTGIDVLWEMLFCGDCGAEYQSQLRGRRNLKKVQR